MLPVTDAKLVTGRDAQKNTTKTDGSDVQLDARIRGSESGRPPACLLCTIMFHFLPKTEFQARLGPIPLFSAFFSNSVFIGHFRDSVCDSVNTYFIWL